MQRPLLDRLLAFAYARDISLAMSPRHDDDVRPERATLMPGEYGRVARPDGTIQWYVRSRKGTWIALSHERVVENEDGTITLLFVG